MSKSRLEAIVRRAIRASLRRNTAGLHSNTLILEHHLRQAVSHPFALEKVMKKLFQVEDIEWLIKELKKLQRNTPFARDIGAWCQEELRVRQGTPEPERTVEEPCY